MTIGMIAKLRCKEGMNAEFEAGFQGMQKAVKENEPGCIQYDLLKSRSDETVYFVMEQYKDEESIAQHGKSDACRAAGASMGPASGGRPEIEVMDLVEED